MISVICVCFNAEKYINEAIDSVLNQTFKEIEIIVIDDGSTDSTISLASKYLTYSNFILLRRGHTGNPGLLRNEAIEYSKFDIIAFIDSDDVWLPNKLEIQIKYLHNYDMVCSNAIRLYQENKIFDSIMKSISDTIIKKDRKRMIPKIVFDNLQGGMQLDLPKLLIMNYVIPSSVLIKKSVFKDSGGFEQVVGKRGEDYLLWLNLLKKYKMLIIDELLIKYRIHNSNLSLQSFDERIKLLDRTIEIRAKFLDDENTSIANSAKIGCENIYHELFKLTLSRKQYKVSLSYLRKFISNYPNKLSINFFVYVLMFISVKVLSLLFRR